MSIILKGACLFIVQIILLLSLLFLLRGHNYPGGGFIAALVASIGIAFYLVTHQKLPFFINNKIHLYIIFGLFCFVLSMLLPLFFDLPIFTGLWWVYDTAKISIKLGTPLLFDLGVYFCILASVVWLMALIEEEKNA